MSLQFERDMFIEKQITKNLEENLFDDIFDNYTMINDTIQQKNGIDMRAFYNSDIVNVDIKSQADYINDILNTFVLEIFSETNNNGDNNIGWFVNDSLDTDYYLFTRLPMVDLFKYENCIDIIRYMPAEELDDIPSFMINRNGKYGFKPEDIDKFSSYYYPISMDMFKHTYQNSKVFNANSIKKQDIILLNKNKIKRTLNNIGLTRNKLLSDAREVYRTGENKIYNDLDGIEKMHISSRSGEAPVNLVVNYDFYNKICVLKKTV